MRSTIENNNYVLACFLDFKKAFDTVNHERLLEKHYGFRGTLFEHSQVISFKSRTICTKECNIITTTEN